MYCRWLCINVGLPVETNVPLLAMEVDNGESYACRRVGENLCLFFHVCCEPKISLNNSFNLKKSCWSKANCFIWGLSAPALTGQPQNRE